MLLRSRRDPLPKRILTRNPYEGANPVINPNSRPHYHTRNSEFPLFEPTRIPPIQCGARVLELLLRSRRDPLPKRILTGSPCGGANPTNPPHPRPKAH